MKLYLKTKLIIIFTAIIVMTGLITAVIGTLLISKGVMDQVQDKVRNDLNAAKEICEHRINNIRNTVYFSTLQNSIKESIISDDKIRLKICLEQFRKAGSMEMIAITDKKGIVLWRAHNHEFFGDDQSKDQVISRVLTSRKMVAGLVVVSREELQKEGDVFAKRAYIPFIDTPMSKKRTKHEEKAGMMLKAAAPIWSHNGDFIGVLYGGDLINQNYGLVDKIKNTVYQGETYKGLDMGTATMFQEDLRISTNVMTNDSSRAIGTRVSEEVYDRVIGEGRRWIGRAFVFDAWYISAYDPIIDINGKVIGMLGLGLLEQKFVDLKWRALEIFVAVTIGGMILVLFVSNLFANTITKPLNYIVKVSKKISGGDFSVKVNVESKDELGELGKAFNAMVSALQKCELDLKKETQQQLMRSEKLAALGRMAAGIAHEVNNPLTGVLMYGNILLKNLPQASQEKKDVEIIVHETTRCRDLLKNLLNFAREDVPHKEEVNINNVVHEIISIIENHVYFEKVTIIMDLSDELPLVMIDANQLEQVLMNFVLNAAESMPDGGKLILRTLFDKDSNNTIVKITDTGCGMPEENINKIFDPFFTTKEPGKGTGLGLAVNYGIIQRHGGYINVESRVGAGTTFVITLPAKDVSTAQTGGAD